MIITQPGRTEAWRHAAARGIPARVVELSTAQEAQAQSPSPYGTFGIVRDGRLLSYHYLCRNELEKTAAALIARACGRRTHEDKGR